MARSGGRGVYATYIDLEFMTSPKSSHVNNAGSSLVRAEIFTGYPAAKIHAGEISYRLRTLASNL